MENAEFFKSIVETIREPLLVLDGDLRVVLANRSFSRSFKTSLPCTENILLFDLGNGQWDIPELRTLLLEILSDNHTIEDFPMSHNFPVIGRRSMLLNARKLKRPSDHTEMILLAFEDVTERKKLEARLHVAITETHHQVKNSLNTVLMMLQHRPVDELKKTIEHIKGYVALHEVLTIQTFKQDQDKPIEVKPLIEKLIGVLQAGFSGGTIAFDPDSITLSSRICSSIAVISNELITNSIKHGALNVTLELKQNGKEVDLRVFDDGKGFPAHFQKNPNNKGVGLTLIQALSISDLGDHLKFENRPAGGANVSVTFSTGI